jgi:LPXTG-motif cell wall-anchored protein
MNKLTTVVIGISLFLFATFTGTSAFAAPQTCMSVGLNNVPKGDARYISSLDVDGDGVMCEGNGAGTGTGSGSQPNNVPPVQSDVRDANGNVIPSTGQVDANGKPVKLDSNGKPIQLDEHGNPAKADNLANTGPTGVLIWSGIGLLALAAGAFIVYTKRRTV